MGADTFVDTSSTSPDLGEAFSQARESAAWEHGHRGYTGTIAEKFEYTVIRDRDAELGLDAASFLARDILYSADPRVNDKWGPAGAIAYHTPEGVVRWLFFGWASC